jgi:hypothetical protein
VEEKHRPHVFMKLKVTKLGVAKLMDLFCLHTDAYICEIVLDVKRPHISVGLFNIPGSPIQTKLRNGTALL